MKIYRNWSEYPWNSARWPNFSPRELASKSDGELAIDEPSLDKLQALRTLVNRPMIINSAYRSAAHNRKVGGAKNSEHMKAKAYDVSMANFDPFEFEKAARECGFTGFGYYPKQGFMHIDTGPARTWGTPFRRTASRLAPEPVIPSSGVKSPDGAAAAGAGVLGGLALSAEHLPIAAGLLGNLAPVAQTIAVVAAVALLAYVIWRRRA